MAFIQGKVWATFDAIVRVCCFFPLEIPEHFSWFQVVITQFEVLKDLAIGDERHAALEKKAAEAEDNFTVVTK